MQFLVQIRSAVPPTMPEEERRDLVAREREVGAELLRRGVISTIWRVTGTPDNVGIWTADNADDLHSAIQSLPAFPWMTVQVTPLSTHPLLADGGQLTGGAASDEAIEDAVRLLETAPQQCILYELQPGSGPAYDHHHAAVWPEIQERIRANGIFDYSIFRRDELVISVYRTQPLSTGDTVGSADDEVQARWSELLAEHFAAIVDEEGNPLSAHRVFRLDGFRQ